MEKIKDKLIETVMSKKFQAYSAAVITVVMNDTVAGPAMAEATVTKLVFLTIAYITGQSIADHGKEKAKIELAAKK